MSEWKIFLSMWKKFPNKTLPLPIHFHWRHHLQCQTMVVLSEVHPLFPPWQVSPPKPPIMSEKLQHAQPSLSQTRSQASIILFKSLVFYHKRRIFCSSRWSSGIRCCAWHFNKMRIRKFTPVYRQIFFLNPVSFQTEQ